MAELVLAACGSADGKSEYTKSFNSNLFCVLTSESSQLSLSSYIILISFDLFTFFFLASLIDATRLGPLSVTPTESCSYSDRPSDSDLESAPAIQVATPTRPLNPPDASDADPPPPLLLKTSGIA